MSRTLATLVGLAVLVAAGVVHGLWTDRWQPSTELLDAQERVAALPDDLGAWKGQAYEQDPLALEMAGAAADYSRSFTDPETGERVLVILLAGRASRMAVHRPEHCYTAAGYAMNGKPVYPVEIEPRGLSPALFATGLFSREDAAGPSQLRIFWSFGAAGRWSAPPSPRWTFAREKVLYKLYVLRNVAGNSGPISRDPCVRLLGELLPVLDKTIFVGREE